MASETVDQILSEMSSFLNDSVAAHGFACRGLLEVTRLLEGLPTVSENPDPDIYLSVGDPSTPEGRQYAVWRRSKALAQIARQGPAETMLGQQWIVYFFTAWEHEFRPRLAGACSCPPERLKFPLLGDLRRLRNDVVHHRGIATADNAGKMEVLEHWFHPGDVIYLHAEHFYEFLRIFPWPELRNVRVP
jgi:hypothetical protein